MAENNLSPTKEIIHIDWEGPLKQQEVANFNGPSDFGVYQIYGAHPVYGGETLLYIGLACDQTFSRRIAQHDWCRWTRNPANVSIHLGRLGGDFIPDPLKWTRLISLAERLLISSHYPPYNSQKQLGSLEPELGRFHILNWGSHRDLLPEVSGARWATVLHEIPGYHSFSTADYPHRVETGSGQTGAE